MVSQTKFLQKITFLTTLCLTLLIAACADSPGDSMGSSNVTVIPLTAATMPAPQPLPVVANIKKAGEGPARSAPAYRVGLGDVMKISLYTFRPDGEIQRIYPSGDYDNSNGTVNVREEGTIALPYVGEVKLLGRTQSEISDTIMKGLQKYFKRVQADVRVIEYNSHYVIVTGEVEKPGEQKITVAELRVLAALTAAGGVTKQADLANAEVRHSDGTSEIVDLMGLYNRGDQTQNIILQPGDTIYVPQNHRNKVFVAGEVRTPSAISIPKGRLTLTEAIMEAGGFERITAQRSKIYIVRGGVGNEAIKPASATTPEQVAKEQAQLHATVYTLSMEAPESYLLADQFALNPRDVVYVSPRAITEWDRFLSQLIPGVAQSILYRAIYSN